jgi:hypothetical protein
MAAFNLNTTTVVLGKRNFDKPSPFHLQKNEIAHASNYKHLAQNNRTTVHNGRTVGKYGQFCDDVTANAIPLKPVAWFLFQERIVTFWVEELHSMLVE